MTIRRLVSIFCGEGGIRTPGGLHLNGFQDRRNRPLCHLSGVGFGKNGLQKYTKIENHQSFYNLSRNHVSPAGRSCLPI